MKRLRQTLFVLFLPMLLILALVDWLAQKFDIRGHKRFTPMPDGVGIKYVSVLYRSEGYLK